MQPASPSTSTPPRPAALWRRIVAGLIDVPFVIAAAAAVTGAAFGLAKLGLLNRFDREPADGDTRGTDTRETRIGRALLKSRRFAVATECFAIAAAVATRNTPGPGYRALGLRRADARTGGAVSARAALVGILTVRARGRLLKLAFRPLTRRAVARMRETNAASVRIRREHAGDPEAIKRLPVDVRPSSPRSCAWLLPQLVALYATDLPTLRGPLRQTLAERVAGIVVTDSRSNARPDARREAG